MSQQERWQLGQNAPEIYQRVLVPALFTSWAQLLIAQVALQRGERVLDLACGTGVVTRLAALHLRDSGIVVGADLNAGMLAVAQATPSEGNSVPIEWRQEDAEALSFPAAAFDVVLCQQGLQYFPDRLQALREMRRVLTPTGRVGLMVWRSIVHTPGFRIIAEALEQYISPAASAVMHAPFAFGDSAEALETLIAEAGFREISVNSHTRMVRFDSPESFVRNHVMGSPLVSHVTQADADAREGFERAVIAAMQPYVTPEGTAFPIESHLVLALA